MSPKIRIITAVVPPMMLLAGLLFTVLADSYIRKRQKKLFHMAIALVFTMIAKDVMDYVFLFVKPDRALRMVVTTYGYLALPVLILVFYYLILDKKRYIPAWCLVGINTAVYLINPFTEIAFKIDENSSFIRKPLGFTCHIISLALLIGLLVIAIRERKKRKLFYLIPFVIFFIAGAAALDIVLPENQYQSVSYLTLALVICCAMTYVWLHMQFFEEHRNNELAQQRIRIMMSQIQPHFIFNTIATFKALCRTDPEKAAQVAEKFGVYLRQNLDSLDTVELIPIAKELEPTRVYADIETVRFENVRVEYDIEDTQFSLPPLTVQPMVENAIRHGVREKSDGIVRVSTRYRDGCHVIEIQDNGVGFDTGAPFKQDENHIGIANVRERLEEMCGGALDIESLPGEGTRVVMRIPQK